MNGRQVRCLPSYRRGIGAPGGPRQRSASEPDRGGPVRAGGVRAGANKQKTVQPRGRERGS